ncbi:HWE histidine kinase domain-containing protein [Defluviimonas sp. SAOS-178_SWC]|uniref:HWE histidine kinase domain-containing protein n=1 Tax=Defluviimonas sp. SAOS-178_SWC TaxID=3121287 RepID=UPI003D80A7A3
MASHTMRNSGDFDAFQETFSGRLRAIAAAHDSIFSEGAGEPLLGDLIRRQLAPYTAEGNDRLVLSGPPVRVSTPTAHALGLILHELATSAAKYGALSSQGGIIPVVFLTGDGGDALPDELLSIDLVSKPVDYASLDEAMSRAIGQAGPIAAA